MANFDRPFVSWKMTTWQKRDWRRATWYLHCDAHQHFSNSSAVQIWLFRLFTLIYSSVTGWTRTHKFPLLPVCLIAVSQRSWISIPFKPNFFSSLFLFLPPLPLKNKSIVYLLDCRPLKRISSSENSLRGAGVVVFFWITFPVVAVTFAVDLAAGFAPVFGSFISGVVFNLFFVGSFVDSFSFFRAGTGAAHCTKQWKTSSSKVNCAVIHNIGLGMKCNTRNTNEYILV